jgi:hypothetical protein
MALVWAILGMIITCASVAAVSPCYFEMGYHKRSPEWVTDVFYAARIRLGSIRPAPTNEEMIQFHLARQKEFDSLITNYYALIGMRNRQNDQDYQLDKINQRLRASMAELGIMRIDPAGPFYVDSIYKSRADQHPFVELGVELYPIDRGWLSGKDKGRARVYAYAPPVKEPGRPGPAIGRFFSTGDYALSPDIPPMCEGRFYHCCGLQIYLDNWAIANCVYIDR